MRSAYRSFQSIVFLCLVSLVCACGVETEDDIDENDHDAIGSIPPRPRYHPPHPYPDDGPAYPTQPRDCVGCHKSLPPPTPKPSIPTKCLKCHTDPHGGNYPPGQGPDFEPGDFPIDPMCLQCHQIKRPMPDPILTVEDISL